MATFSWCLNSKVKGLSSGETNSLENVAGDVPQNFLEVWANSSPPVFWANPGKSGATIGPLGAYKGRLKGGEKLGGKKGGQ